MADDDLQRRHGVFSRWGYDIARDGYTAIPNYIIHINRFLSGDMKLSPGELWVLLVIVSCWRDNTPPQPSKKYISDRIGIGQRQVSRIIISLESKGFIRRVTGGSGIYGSNRYDMSGTVRVLRYLVAMKEQERRNGTRKVPQIKNIVVDTPPIHDFGFNDNYRDDEDDVPF